LANTRLTLKQIARLYYQLRRRYFLDAEALRPGTALHVPPPANEVTFGWLPENSNARAQTDFDEDGTPHLIRFDSKHTERTVIRELLLHELTHVRLGPDPACGGYNHAGRNHPGSRAWRRETVRLAVSGAIRL